MSSMNESLLDKIAHADFSMETDFKSVLRKRLFESGANKKSGVLQFQRLSYGICGRRYGFPQAAGTEKEK